MSVDDRATVDVWSEFSAGDDIKRDRWGRYRLPDPDTGQERSWTRVTTLASTLSDQYGLTRWKQRMVAEGLARRSSMLAEVATANGDRKILDDLCDRAMEAAGANDRRELGTALHAMTQAHDLGRPLEVPDLWQADIDAYGAAVADAGLTVHPEFVERVVVCPELGVAGTFDRLVGVGDDLVVADVKTGRNLYHGEIAVQLACYARAAHLWCGDHWEPMPAVDTERALVIHLPGGEATAEIVEVDIAAGWEAAKLSVAVRGWRRRRNLSRAFEPVQQLAVAGSLQARRNNLIGRIRRLDHEARADLAHHWPAGVPTLRDDGHELDELAAIEVVLEAVETSVEAPFDPPERPATVYAEADAVEVTVERLRRLPADLLGTVEAEVAGRVPSMHSGLVSTEHLRILDGVLAEVEEVHRQRIAGIVADGLNDRAVLESATGQTELEACTADDVDRLTVLTETMRTHPDCFTGEEHVVIDCDAFIAAVGSKREVLALGRGEAERFGLAVPRSSDDVMSSPMLAAHVLCAAGEQPNPQDNQEE